MVRGLGRQRTYERSVRLLSGSATVDLVDADLLLRPRPREMALDSGKSAAGVWRQSSDLQNLGLGGVESYGQETTAHRRFKSAPSLVARPGRPARFQWQNRL